MAGLLEGHIAAVTGGGSGIGQGICQAYAREGARVIILDVNINAAKETMSLIAATGGTASAIKLDVTDRQACKAVAANIANKGNISILVNNAGINRRNPITGDAIAVSKDWDDILSINLDGMFNVTHAFLDQLRATRGRIVNIGSIQSFVHVSWPNSAAYTTSKHGVLGFTRALAAELGKDGVRVNAIGPGLIETKINAEARAKNPEMVAMVNAAHSAEPAWQTGGHRGTGGLPCVRYVGLRNGLHRYGRRRLSHGLRAIDGVRLAAHAAGADIFLRRQALFGDLADAVGEQNRIAEHSRSKR